MVNRRIIDQPEAISLSSDDYLIADNAKLGTRRIQFTRLLSGATPLPPDYITGFEIVRMTNTTISISSGYARSSDNLRNMQLSTSLIKDISTTFDLGNNAGCMPSGLTLQANTKYYVFAISTSGGQTDIIVDADENCSNGLVDNVVVSNNFDKFVCIGSITTDANSQISIINSYVEYFPKNYKSTIIGWGTPDYSAGITKSFNTNYTAESNGELLFANSRNSGHGNSSCIIIINGTKIPFNYSSANYTTVTGVVRLFAGDTYSISLAKSSVATIIFYPITGDN